MTSSTSVPLAPPVPRRRTALAVALAVAAFGLAGCATPLVTQGAATGPALDSSAGPEVVQSHVYVTGYTYFDNTPAGRTISAPVLHSTAEGAGTYEDPVTLAVGHVLNGDQDILDYPQGTRFYIPSLERYFIVEDTCGDGTKPQNGPCHRLNAPGDSAPKGATAWIDVWLDGQAQGEQAVNACAAALTGLHTVVIRPAAGYRVAGGHGVLHDGRCDVGRGETPVKG